MRRLMIFVLLLLGATAFVISQETADKMAMDARSRIVYLGYTEDELQAATGDLTAGATSDAYTVGNHVDVVIVLKPTTMTLADGDDEVDFYFQTTYDGATTWTDLENLHYANADNGDTDTVIVRLGPHGPISSADKGTDNTDGALADDTKRAWAVGSQIRIKTTVTGATAPTYAYSAQVFLR